MTSVVEVDLQETRRRANDAVAGHRHPLVHDQGVDPDLIVVADGNEDLDRGTNGLNNVEL